MSCVPSLLALFTRLPLRGGDPREAARCAYLLPAVALLEGLLASIPLLLLRGAYMVAASLSYLTHIYVTGAVHLDGLLDYADAAMPGFRGEDALRVMKDPRRGVGAFVAGAAHALITVSSLAWLASRLGALAACTLLIASYTLSSLLMLSVLVLLPPEPYRGLASIFREGLSSRWALFATYLQSVYLLVGLPAPTGLLGGLAASILAWLALTRDVWRRLGFANGDVAGACFEACRAAFLVGAVTALLLV